uniref:Protochlorophyllide reductase n=2 Tax=Odontella aurita TaxID=265563 RepID=A0A7S4JE01_9STRA|mmetsp:Transcript_44601/g.136037  ORF Transcript_44601/g.136037 Transcript_44601/m.136037 type:complete len:426 (+) Transcript_44601:456-1733(+)
MPTTNAVGAVALLLGLPLALYVGRASRALPPPTDPAAREAVRPYHDVEGAGKEYYARVPWYHEEERGWGAKGSGSSEATLSSSSSSSSPLGDKFALVTGGSSGIGRAAASELCRMGIGGVTITSRSLGRAAKAAGEMVASGCCARGQVRPTAADFADLDDVRALAARVRETHGRLDFLVLNAGGAIGIDHKFDYVTAATGHEYLYAGNYLGQFLLLNLLLDLVEKSGPSPRISVTSSIAHWVSTPDLDSILPSGEAATKSLQGAAAVDGFEQYGNTKLLQILMCFELQRRLGEESNITVTPVAPGYVNTDIMLQGERLGREKGNLVGVAISPVRGAQTTLHALLSHDIEGQKGYFLQPYWSPLHQRNFRTRLQRFLHIAIWEGSLQRWGWGAHMWLPHPNAHQRAFARRLWEESLDAVGLSSPSL